MKYLQKRDINFLLVLDMMVVFTSICFLNLTRVAKLTIVNIKVKLVLYKQEHNKKNKNEHCLFYSIIYKPINNKTVKLSLLFFPFKFFLIKITYKRFFS
jgi:hypothetical protein